MVHPPSGYRILFCCDCTASTICLLVVSPLSLSVEYLFFFFFFFSGFKHPPVDGCSTSSCDFGALEEEDELSTLPP